MVKPITVKRVGLYDNEVKEERSFNSLTEFHQWLSKNFDDSVFVNRITYLAALRWKIVDFIDDEWIDGISEYRLFEPKVMALAQKIGLMEGLEFSRDKNKGLEFAKKVDEEYQNLTFG